jgi:hypothetical protein
MKLIGPAPENVPTCNLVSMHDNEIHGHNYFMFVTDQKRLTKTQKVQPGTCSSRLRRVR